MHRIPLPELPSYLDELAGLERILWEVEKMKLLRAQNKQAFDELHREIRIIESNSLSTFGNSPSPSHPPPPWAAMGPLLLEFSSGMSPPSRAS